jgi:hypothetical protein
MKKLFAAAILGLSVTSGWAQGTILFQNTGVTFTSTAERRVFDVDGTTPLSGTNYAAGLFYVEGAGQNMDSATSGLLAFGTVNPSLGLAFFRASTSASVGYWLNNAAVGNARLLEGVIAGETATLQVRVWDVTRFASYAEAVANGGITGKSATWNYVVPQPGAPVNQTYLNDFRSFQLIPEPSTIALGVLGLGSLLLFRRKKA